MLKWVIQLFNPKSEQTISEQTIADEALQRDFDTEELNAMHNPDLSPYMNPQITDPSNIYPPFDMDLYGPLSSSNLEEPESY